MSKDIMCPDCHGDGERIKSARPDSRQIDPDMEPCATCRGVGWLEELACVRCGEVTKDGELCTECQVEEAEGQWEPVRCETPLSEIHNTKE